MICGTPEDDFNRWSPLHVSAFPQEWPVIALAIANPSRIPPRSFDVFFLQKLATTGPLVATRQQMDEYDIRNDAMESLARCSTSKVI